METNSAVRALSALAQDTRLSAFRLLVQAGGEGLPAGRIAQSLGVALPTLSFHLKELVNAGLVASQPVSRFVIYRARFDAMRELLGFLQEDCCRGIPGSGASGTADPGCDPSCTPKPERSCP